MIQSIIGPDVHVNQRWADGLKEGTHVHTVTLLVWKTRGAGIPQNSLCLGALC